MASVLHPCKRSVAAVSLSLSPCPAVPFRPFRDAKCKSVISATCERDERCVEVDVDARNGTPMLPLCCCCVVVSVVNNFSAQLQRHQSLAAVGGNLSKRGPCLRLNTKNITIPTQSLVPITVSTAGRYGSMWECGTYDRAYMGVGHTEHPRLSPSSV